MKEEELLEKLLNQLYRDEDIGEDYTWIKKADEPSSGFVLINTGSGGDVFIIRVLRGKIEVA